MINDYFKQNVAEKDILGIAIYVKDSVLYDRTLKDFDELLSYAEDNIDDLYQEHDGEEFDNESISEELLTKQLAKLPMNFSKERIDFIRKICKELYGKKDEKPVVEIPNCVPEIKDETQDDSAPEREEPKREYSSSNGSKVKFIVAGITVAIAIIVIAVLVIVKTKQG